MGSLFQKSRLPLTNTWMKIEKGQLPTGRYMSLAFPHRENFLAKEDRKVDSGAARPGSRRGLPPSVTVFANAKINKSTSYPCIAPRVQKHAPPRLCANATYRRTLGPIAAHVIENVAMCVYHIYMGGQLNISLQSDSPTRRNLD